MISLTTGPKGYIQQRESQHLEFKERFRRGDNLLEYARTLVAMANNQGGSIVFGVQDGPRVPVGLQDDSFENFDQRDMNRFLLEYFSHDLDWSMQVQQVAGKAVGVISVEEAKDKPIICSRNHTKKKLREGAIYFRYRGETREIRFKELKDLLDAERAKERELWMSHIESIARVGPRHVQVVDALRGEMQVGDAKVLIDERIVEKLKLVEEGHFDEKKGAPALRLTGELEGLVAADHVAYTEAAYPYTQADILEKLPLNSYDFQALSWKLQLKGDARYHAVLRTGPKSRVNKYSEKALERIRESLREAPDCVAEARAEYNASRRVAG